MAEMSEEEYQRIRQGVLRRRAEARAANVAGTEGSERRRFETVDAFIAYLDSLPTPEGRLAGPDKKAR